MSTFSDRCENKNKLSYINDIEKYDICKQIPIINTQNNIFETIINNYVFNPTSLDGFKTSIQFAGCSGEDLSQENHILGVSGGNTSPKNIVIQTDGSGAFFGSFFRDDSLTFPKGDVRGSGANDLSISRQLCSQVASGDFSSILGGRNNTASGDLSVVVGGSNNISSASNSTIIGGNINSNNGNNSTIITGISNEIIIGGTGYNVIGGGTNNKVKGSYNVVLNGIGNSINDLSSNISYNVILSGSNNIIKDASYCWIGVGNSNFVSGNYNVINSGLECSNTGIEFCCIGGGISNNINNGRYNSIAAGISNKIFGQNTMFCGIFAGSNNLIQDASYSSIICGQVNGITGGIANSIVSGKQNSIILNNQGYNFIGAGSNNIINGGYNGIVAGLTNKIDSSSSIYNAIVSGQTNQLLGSISNSFIGAGINNTINGANNASIVAGSNNTVSGNNSTIAGGNGNNISIQNSFICGEGLQLTQYDYPSAAFGRFNLQGVTGATGGSTGSFRIFMVGNGTSSSNRTNAFSVTQDGVCIAGLSFSTGGADFGEFFQSHSRYTIKLPICETVVMIDESFIGKKIDPITKQFVDDIENGFQESDMGKIMLSSDTPNHIQPFGVVVQNSGYIGNAYDEEWQGKYERDQLNNYVYEDEIVEYEEQEFTFESKEVEEKVLEKLLDENGNVSYLEKIINKTIQIKNPVLETFSLYDEDGIFIEYIKKPKMISKTKIRKDKKISSSYDPNLTYIPRSERPEWNLIGLLGQVLVKDNQRIKSDWKQMNKINDQIHKYFIR